MKHQDKVDPEGAEPKKKARVAEAQAKRDEKETARKAGDKETARKAGDKEKHRKAARDQSSIKRIYIEVTKGRAVLRRPVATRASCIFAL